MKTSEHDTDKVRELLTDYAGWLLGCGATCIKLETNLRRIADAYGQNLELTITPHHVHVAISDRRDRVVFTSIAAARGGVTSFDTITRLSALSWKIADTDMHVDEARRNFDNIVSEKPHHLWAAAPLVALANASFCRLFGGDAPAMAMVFAATLAGYCLKLWLAGLHTDIRLVFLACSFVSSMVGASGFFFQPRSNPQLAVGTSILYLIPGVPFLNSFSDMLHKFYLCSLGRLMDALVLTACLSIGLCAGMMATGTGMF